MGSNNDNYQEQRLRTKFSAEQKDCRAHKCGCVEGRDVSYPQRWILKIYCKQHEPKEDK